MLAFVSARQVSAGKSSGADGRFLDRLERATGMLSSAIANAEQDLHSALDGDTAAISALRCLQVGTRRGCHAPGTRLDASPATHLWNIAYPIPSVHLSPILETPHSALTSTLTL